MKVLGIDSASGLASVAVVDDTRVLAEQRSETAGHRADLLVLIDAVCHAAGVTPGELDAVAIGAGPGSFTGLRIGMATAKGIAFAASKPLWAVSTLAAVAHARLTTHPEGLVVAVLDARRGEVYAGAYRLVGGKVTLQGEERVLPPAELAAFAATSRREHESLVFVGDAADCEISATPSGVSVAQLALAGGHVDVLVGGVPTYIRPSEAEIRYPDGVPGALRKR
ncbi:MAG TPA: tRNA (adenosine(37)-N6)-threonylcarbamoyltransferase complex dimerization subunit type 1 TsaB [Kofleriaceae bacterium]|nr:tRNA (adenosine(37)-N6)-threonylcarbamoyltransferase complex dimerization subunit type 1 TsaB [Kofleriaceae bacterium]